jgi:hypothetical protein
MPAMPDNKKKKTSLYIERDRLAKLKAISDRTLIPISTLMRRGIDLVIEEYSRRK